MHSSDSSRSHSCKSRASSAASNSKSNPSARRTHGSISLKPPSSHNASANTKPLNVFYVWYTELCRRQNSSPIPSVRNPNQRNDQVLEFNADRIKVEDWEPIINAIRLDTSLHVISIHSKMPNQKFLDEADSEEKVKKIKKWFGAICTRFILKNLLKGLGNCIKCSPVISCLELDGLKLFGEYLALLLKCLEANKTIKYVSFRSSPIGDDGCFAICNTLHSLPNIEVLNLSGCGLCIKSGESISKLIKFQQINRYCESWHSSLRYEDPLVNKMPGLRRITINNNPKITDEGLDFILNELADDLWIKAIDMQRCGITEHMADKIIDTVDYSRSLEVFDLRNNMLSNASLETILDVLKVKQTNDSAGEYQWCFTSTTLDTLTYGSYVSLINTKTSKNYEIKKATLKRQSKTMPQLQIKPTQTQPKVNTKNELQSALKAEHADMLSKAEQQLISMYNSLREEQEKRIQCELKCEALQKQIDELLNQKKNQLILKEFKNMKQYIKKFISFVMEHGGEAERNGAIIQDLQNALDEVHVLSRPYESSSQRLVTPEQSEISLIKEEMPIISSDLLLNTEDDIEEECDTSNFSDSPIPISVNDADLKLKNLFGNLIGAEDDTSQDVESISLESDEIEKRHDVPLQNTNRSDNSPNSVTLQRLLEELSMEDNDGWSTDDLSTIYSDCSPSNAKVSRAITGHN